MLTKIIVKLANIYDQLGQNKKADRLDRFLLKYAAGEKEPSPEDLMKEESWLAEEGIESQDPLEGLTGEDLKGAQAYLSGTKPEEIPALLEKLKQQQSEILSELSKLMPTKTSPDLLPKQQPIIPEAALLQDFKKLADQLDKHRLTSAADRIDRILTKMAQGLPPDDDDMNWDEDEDFEEMGGPDTEELQEMEQEDDDFFYKSLELIHLLAEGHFNSLQQAQREAAELLQEYDSKYNVLEMPEFPEPTADNVIPFKSR